MSSSPKDIAVNWLNDFANHLAVGNAQGVASCFHEEGWLRDILIFSWNNRSLEGPAKIRSFLQENLKPRHISDARVDERPFLVPEAGKITPTKDGVSSGFTFETPIAHGQGFFTLMEVGRGEWKALTVLMMMEDLKGHEELGYELGMYGDHTLAWGDVKMERQRRIEEDPHVLIVGGGQNGLNVAARFKQMQIPTLIVEKNARVGDNWRQRYPMLTLHTPKTQHRMLYQPHPETWPMYTPRDKLANWLEQYVDNQDLTVWTNSKPLPTPTYDFETRKWTVNVDRNGETVTIHPSHIVLATGTLGAPKMPTLVGQDVFKGKVIHACSYQGAREYAGKRVIVVGAGNTSADVCQDLTSHGASVTMVQRSTTCVQSIKNTREALLHAWPEGVPSEVSDMKFTATPLPLLTKEAAKVSKAGWQAVDREMHEGLRKTGFNLNLGPNGTGVLMMVFERFGGYWADVGCADLIISGKLKVKQGVEVERLAENEVFFSDGSSLPADAIIFATGYENIREVTKKTFGEKTIGMTSEVWGLDEEGELRGSYRPTGHPGLWYASGDFFNSRFSSKQLALEIKAIELGLMKL
ncbi:flavin-binding monooxygenase [Moniliophthora roreri MCA 2997]|uniref:Flavin-binding monooxygenase n=1 Tax=Moniliophthora roreri (strain MCA 2997) TaxID=1381753 RepID=V2YLX9_MONRO|nr:flavin-binding monooxygenase [Moniliophthora roreri MCA 2997]